MRYLPKSPAERIEMLKQIGAGSIDDLFSTIPEEYRLERDLAVPRQMGVFLVQFAQRKWSADSSGSVLL